MSDTKPVLVIDGNVVGDVFKNATEDYVEVTADGVKTTSQLLDELYVLIDFTKDYKDSRIETSGGILYRFTMNDGNNYFYTSARLSAATEYEYGIRLRSSGSQRVVVTNGTISDNSSSVPTDGSKITFYYGNKTSQVDLTTYANKCMMSNEESVEETIEDIDDKLDNIFNYRTLLTSSDDLNTLFKVGNYRAFLGSGLPINRPSTSGSYDATIKVEFTESDAMTIQTFEQFISGVPYTYKRRYFNGSWGNWYKLTWSALS